MFVDVGLVTLRLRCLVALQLAWLLGTPNARRQSRCRQNRRERPKMPRGVPQSKRLRLLGRRRREFSLPRTRRSRRRKRLGMVELESEAGRLPIEVAAASEQSDRRQPSQRAQRENGTTTSHGFLGAF